MGATPAYATVKGSKGPLRLAAQTCTDDPRMVAVWIVNGGTLGLYKLERFESERVTSRTLAQLFTAST